MCAPGPPCGHDRLDAWSSSPPTPPAVRRSRACSPRVAVGLDFDGTLAPIVDDPARAWIHPDAPELVVALAEKVRSLAIVTGRPVGQLLELSGLEAIGRDVARHGQVLEVHGQYGNEHWTSAHGMVHSPTPRPPSPISSPHSPAG